MCDIIKEQWTYTAKQNDTAIIVPDGCRVIVIKQNKYGHVTTTITPLAACSYQVEITKATRVFGLRLNPGTIINEEQLMSYINVSAFDDLQKGDDLAEFCQLNNALTEALAGLGSDVNDVNFVAKHLGVSIRTLQRHVKQQTGKSPQFWKSLVRARRCARLLGQSVALVESAFLANYADQAHMTREIQRWFNCTPLSLKQGWLKSELMLSGYD
jgi:AraC-like DNA-binding protein